MRAPGWTHLAEDVPFPRLNPPPRSKFPHGSELFYRPDEASLPGGRRKEAKPSLPASERVLAALNEKRVDFADGI